MDRMFQSPTGDTGASAYMYTLGKIFSMPEEHKHESEMLGKQLGSRERINSSQLQSRERMFDKSQVLDHEKLNQDDRHHSDKMDMKLKELNADINYKNKLLAHKMDVDERTLKLEVEKLRLEEKGLDVAHQDNVKKYGAENAYRILSLGIEGRKVDALETANVLKSMGTFDKMDVDNAKKVNDARQKFRKEFDSTLNKKKQAVDVAKGSYDVLLKQKNILINQSLGKKWEDIAPPELKAKLRTAEADYNKAKAEYDYYSKFRDHYNTITSKSPEEAKKYADTEIIKMSKLVKNKQISESQYDLFRQTMGVIIDSYTNMMNNAVYDTKQRPDFKGMLNKDKQPTDYATQFNNLLNKNSGTNSSANPTKPQQDSQGSPEGGYMIDSSGRKISVPSFRG